jgi:ADP-ribose pyrophosphatase YjhB (NUDIX family)
MNAAQFRRDLAGFLRRNPWLVNLGRQTWRLRQARFTLGAVAVVINTSDELLLVEHVFHPYFPWGLPGGWVDRGESPMQTVQRELLEELELAVEVGPLLHVSVELPGHLDLAYLCTATGPVGKLSAELLAHRWIHLDDLPPLHRFQQVAIQAARHQGASSP